MMVYNVCQAVNISDSSCGDHVVGENEKSKTKSKTECVLFCFEI